MNMNTSTTYNPFPVIKEGDIIINSTSDLKYIVLRVVNSTTITGRRCYWWVEILLWNPCNNLGDLYYDL